MSEKKVRFAKYDPKISLTYNKQIHQPQRQSSQYCDNCGSLQFDLRDSSCKRCLATNVEIQKKLGIKPRSQSFSKSDQSLIINRDDKNLKLDLPTKITDLLRRKSFEFENLDEKKLKESRSKKFNSFHQNNSIPERNGYVWKCFKCNEQLNPGELAVSAEPVFDSLSRWHIKCFVCSVCSSALVDLLYYSKDKKLYCKEHYTENTLRSNIYCAACDLSIGSDEFIRAENKYWHPEHFCCWNCEKTLGGKKYIVTNSKPYCFDCHLIHFSKKCQTCQLRIRQDIMRLSYENLDWHAEPDCFKCYACHKSLLETHFLLKNNLLFCSIECKKKTSII